MTDHPADGKRVILDRYRANTVLSQHAHWPREAFSGRPTAGELVFASRCCVIVCRLMDREQFIRRTSLPSEKMLVGRLTVLEK